MKIWLLRIARGTLFLAAFLFVWRPNFYITFGHFVPTPKISDYLILCAGIAALLGFGMERGWHDKARMTLLAQWGKRLSLLLVSFGIGALWAHHLGYIATQDDVIEIGRICVGVTIFMLTLFLGYREIRYTRLLGLSVLGATIMIPLLFLSERMMLEHFWVVGPSSYTLLGFQTSTIYTGAFLLAPLLIGMAYFLFTDTRRRYGGLLFTALITALLLWASSRAAWSAALIGSVVLIWFAWSQKKSIQTYIHDIALLAGAVLLAFILVPSSIRNTALIRIFPKLDAVTYLDRSIILHVPYCNPNATAIVGGVPWSLRLSTRCFTELGELDPRLQFAISRGTIWKSYAREIPNVPLGTGLSYVAVFQDVPSPSFQASKSFERGANAHSIWLQLYMAGGLLGLIAFGIMLWNVYKSFPQNLWQGNAVGKDRWWWPWLTAMFVATLVDATFIDTLEVRWFWFFLALIVVAGENERVRVEHPEEVGQPHNTP